MIGTLQSLRFIFMMMIFMSHFAYRDICAFDAGGDCGVVYFFMLSGFVCSLGYGQQLHDGSFNYGTFIWKRLKKFYPMHLLCLLVFLLVSHAAFNEKVLLNALLLQSWVPDADWYFSCNKVSWFLSSLMFCYVVFPWVYRVMSGWFTLIVVFVYILVYWLTPYDRINVVLYVFPVVRFVDFYLGMLLCRLYERKPGMIAGSWIEMLMIVCLTVTLAVYPMMDAKLRNAPLFWLVMIPLIIVFAEEKGFISWLLKSKPMLFLASLTLPLFLTHQMLLDILLHHLPDMPAVVMLAVCLLVVLMISWCMQIIFSRLLRL